MPSEGCRQRRAGFRAAGPGWRVRRAARCTGRRAAWPAPRAWAARRRSRISGTAPTHARSPTWRRWAAATRVHREIPEPRGRHRQAVAASTGPPAERRPTFEGQFTSVNNHGESMRCGHGNDSWLRTRSVCTPSHGLIPPECWQRNGGKGINSQGVHSLAPRSLAIAS